MRYTNSSNQLGDGVIANAFQQSCVWASLAATFTYSAFKSAFAYESNWGAFTLNITFLLVCAALAWAATTKPSFSKNIKFPLGLYWLATIAQSIFTGQFGSDQLISLLLIGVVIWLTCPRRIATAATIGTALVCALALLLQLTGRGPKADTCGLFIPMSVQVSLGLLIWVTAALTRYHAEFGRHLMADRAKAQEEQQQKNVFFVSMNHELRNPLTAMAAAVDILERIESQRAQNGNSDPVAQKALIAIRSTTTTVLDTLNDVLDYERISFGQVQSPYAPFSVRKVCDDIISAYTIPAIANKCQLTARVSRSTPDIWLGAEGKIRRVLANLVSNAIKYAPGTAIRIEFSEAPNGLEFEVSDKGPGMSSVAMEHLFQPFASSLGKSGSSGLGLSICQHIVEVEFKGTISLSSSKGSGTRFRINLPLQKVQAKHEEPDSYLMSISEETDTSTNQEAGIDRWTKGGQSEINEATDVRSQSRRAVVLLVDDEPDNRELIAIALSSYGYEVMTATTSQQCLEMLQTLKVDVAIVDHNLSAQSLDNGIELTKKLDAVGVPIILGFSGRHDPVIEASWLECGAKQVIHKPASIEDVAETIGRYLVRQ